MKKIKSIKNGLFSRNISLARMALGAGKDFLSKKDGDFAQNLIETLESKSGIITHELGLMKGSVMKAGQTLSTYMGEFFPENVKKLLATLENQSYFLEWNELKKQVPSSWFEQIEFDQNPLAAASIGQVHLGRDKNTGEAYAVKIQYPGIRRAINRDIFTIKLLVNSLKIAPGKLDISEIYDEIKEMLYQEMNYEQELESILEFKSLIGDNPLIKVLTPIENFCTKDILTTKLSSGHSLRSEHVQGLPQSKRDELGKAYLNLFCRELYEWALIQTDGHFGNYLIEIDGKNANWFLLDFGATKRLEGDFLNHYRNMISSVIVQDRDKFFDSFKNLGRIDNDKSLNHDLIWEYLEVMGQPFQSDSYDWGASNIPEQAMAYLPKLMKNLPEGKAPKDTIFIDRKVASVFYVLKQLRCKFNAREVFSKYI